MARAARALARGRRFAAAADVTVSPSYLPDLADAALDLLVDGETGVWHLASAGEASWAELGWAARRPPRSVLGSGRGGPMPPLGAALARHAETLRAGPARVSAGAFLTRFRPPG